MVTAKEIISRRDSGETVKGIAASVGVSKQRIYQILNSAGVRHVRPALVDRLMAGVVVEDRGHSSACWVWGRWLHQGYGVLLINGKRKLAHRASYEVHVGEIPAGLVLDHLCRNPECINPAHLEPVTNQENVRRGNAAEVAGARMRNKTHCPSGHPYSGENLRLTHCGYRICKECQRADWRRRKRDSVGVFGGNGAGQGGTTS